MSAEEIENLVSLEEAKFDARVHLALSWVRATVTSPDGAFPELDAAFRNEFSDRERKCIVATMQAQFVLNLVFNTVLSCGRKLPGKCES